MIVQPETMTQIERLQAMEGCIKSKQPHHSCRFPLTNKYAATCLNNFYIIQLIIRKSGQLFKQPYRSRHAPPV